MDNQTAKLVFAQNMQSVLGTKSLKKLVGEAKSKGIVMNYPYVNTVRKGAANASTDKCDDIVAMLKLLPGYDWIELWMFFVPGYFKLHTKNMLDNNQIQQEYLGGFVSELLATARTLQVLPMTDKQLGQLTELSKYICQKDLESLPARQ